MKGSVELSPILQGSLLSCEQENNIGVCKSPVASGLQGGRSRLPNGICALFDNQTCSKYPTGTLAHSLG